MKLMAEIVGVHGILNQQSGRHQMIAVWAPALADGIERAAGHAVAVPAMDAAFYGDLFLSSSRPGGKAPASEQGWGERDADDLAAVVDEVAPAGDIGDDEATQDTKARTSIPKPVIALLRRLDRVFGSRAASLLFLGEVKQVRRYLLDPKIKQEADARVADAVRAGSRVLIGHSLGSVAAFEFVRQNPDHQLDLLLTLGSPLSLKTVRALMPAPTYGEGGLPPSVRRWVSLRDQRDPVTSGGPLKTYWPRVEDDDSITNQTDAHAVERYLGKAQTGRAVLGVLPQLGESTAR